MIMVFASCAQEVVAPSQQVAGRYALDDESGLTNEYIVFSYGELYAYTSGTPYPLAENIIWNNGRQAFREVSREVYRIQNGLLYCNNEEAPIAKDEEDRLKIGERNYVRLDDFREEPYSIIRLERDSYEHPLQAGDYSFPVSVQNPIQVGELTASTSADWISEIKIKDDLLSYRLSATKTLRTATISVNYTQATKVQVTIRQAPATFIRLDGLSKTIGYSSTLLEIPYTIEGMVQSAELTVTSSASWVGKIDVLSNKMVLSIPENNSGAERTAVLALSYPGAEDVTFTLKQEWAQSLIGLTPSSAAPDYMGGTATFTFDVQNPREGIVCTAISRANWITDVVLSGNTVSYKVLENNSWVPRTGKIELRHGSFASAEFILTQAGLTVTSLSLNKTELTLSLGTSETLVAIVVPSEVPLTWTSSNSSVAWVSSSGEVTAAKIGTATITVTTEGGSKSATCSVTVMPIPVDLGLSVKWAPCNLGENIFVDSPETYGAYYAWGETETKDNYDWSTYKFGSSSSGPFTKYNTNSSYGYVDHKTVLEESDDVAHVKLGGGWRIPTDAEWTELRTKCTWIWTTENGVKGRRVTGPNGNSIFLPAAGYQNGSWATLVGSRGIYLSSSLSTDFPDRECGVSFNSTSVSSTFGFRNEGLSIRPVTE